MLYFFLFLCEVIFLTIIERKQWGHLITPLNMLAWPYTIAVLTIILYRYIEPDIPPFYYPSLIVWMIGLILFEIPSSILAKNISRKEKTKDFIVLLSKDDDYYDVLKQFGYFCIALSLLKIRSLAGSLDTFGSDEFSSQYQTSSIFAHFSVILSCIFSYAIYKADKLHKSAFIIIAGSLIGMYAIGTKSWIIAPMLIGYYARLMTGKTRISLKTTVLPIVLIFAIFFLSYFLSIIYVGNGEASEEFFIFIANHFIDYFCGGALTLSLDFQKGFIEPQMTEALFGPILNFFNLLIGHPYVSVVNPVFIDIGVFGENNVRTFFGTIFAYSKSYILFVLLTLIFSIYTNYLYLKSRKSRSIFLLLANCTNLTFLTFGFFDFYWMNLSCYEMPVIFLLMHHFFYKKRIGLKPIRFRTNKKSKYGSNINT